MALASNDDSNRQRSLILLVARGNQQAFKELFDIFHPLIFHFSKRYLRSEYLAEEAVQDIFLKIWIKRESLVYVEDFSAWLFRLSRNYLLNVLKKASRENRIKDEIKLTLDEKDEESDQLLGQNEDIALLGKIMSMLPPQRQEVFRLCRFEEKSYDEVARVLGISKSTVNDHMVKAMKFVKNNFPGVAL